ncbi:MAG: transporter substrate-binding domain-containing protein [Treponema sp.]|nr:transporter substrate-binding domain-containing protein [Treponema sp.]
MIRFWFASLTLSLLLILPCLASDYGSPTVRVGYYENEVFQEGAAPGAYKQGYAYEYYRKLSEYTGWKYEYVYGGFGELYDKFIAGEIDLLAGLAWKKERTDLMYYPDLPMGNETLSLLKHTDDISITVAYSSLKGKRIGVLNSAMVELLQRFLDGHNVESIIVTFDDYEELFESFDSKQVDLLAAEGDGSYNRNNAEVLYQFGTTDYYLCVSAQREDLLDKLNEAQALLFSDEPNYINILRSKYYSVSVSSHTLSHAENRWIETHDSIKVGYLKNYLPFCGMESDGSVTGLVKDIIQGILDELNINGITVEYIGYESGGQMIRGLESGATDIIFPVVGDLCFAEQKGFYQSRAVITSFTDIIYKVTNSSASMDKIGGSSFQHFAVNRNNDMQHLYVEREFPAAQISLYPSIDACLEAVLSGDVSCTTLNASRIEILKNRKYRNLSYRQGPAGAESCFGVKTGNEGLLRLVNRGISMLGTDYATNLTYQYRETLYTYTTEDLIRDHMGSFVSLLLIIVSIIIFLLVRESLLSKKALAAAEKANVSKTTFLNNMSHDIRTPMNAIVGFTTLAASNLDDKKLVSEYLDRISLSSQYLLSLLNDVLDMSRIESGNVKLSEEEVNIESLLEEIKIIVHADIDSKEQVLEVTNHVVHKDVIADKLRLNQVLLNIISNAMKYTPSNGHIWVSVEESDKDSQPSGVYNYKFAIKDDGIGMSEDFQKVVFEPFTREKSSTVNKIQGTGLGMAICKKLVNLM